MLKVGYVCVLVAVVWVGGLGQGLGGWCYVTVGGVDTFSTGFAKPL